MALSPTWVSKTPTHAILDLGVIVVHVIGRNADTWKVTSSHGEPVGEHPTKESAQKYAERFASSMIEKTLASLSELESRYESPTHGWVAKGGCGLLSLRDPPTPDYLDGDGNVKPDVFEQKRTSVINTSRDRLRALLKELGR